ncbi:thioredoxin domain-containing protein [Rhizobium sp. CRIBSB]|nr:thioredoxin domain-containing protein [Rhizobium sp. CRIBSB]
MTEPDPAPLPDPARTPASTPHPLPAWLTAGWVAPAALGLGALALVLSGASWVNFDARVRAYLLANPQVLQEANSALQNREAEQRIAVVNTAARANPALLAIDPRDPAFGPANAKVTVIEFFDFRCPSCKSIGPEFLALMQAHPDVRFVFKDWPILDSPDDDTSQYAARAALAAHRQGKYLPVYQALLAEPALTHESVDRILAEQGVDLTAARTAMTAQDMTRHLVDIHTIGSSLSLVGTPTFFINGQTMVNFAPANLDAAIKAAKAAPPPA